MQMRNVLNHRLLLGMAALSALIPLVGVNIPTAGAVPRAAADDPALITYEGCDDLLASLKERGLEHVGPYGFGNAGYGIFNFGIGDMMGASEGALPATGGDDAGVDFSGTNNQEVDVDEADETKTDGRRLLVLRDGDLLVIDVRDASKPTVRSRLRVSPDDESYAGDGTLLLQGDRALVMVPRYQPIRLAGGDAAAGDVFAQGEPVTDVMVVSVADMARPRILDRVTVNGSLTAARLVGGAARLVVNSVPLNLAFVVPQSGRGAAAALATNKRIIAESTIQDWLPVIQRGRTSGPAVGCADVTLPRQFSGVGMTTVHTVPIADRLRPAAISLQADANSGATYVSKANVYVTAASWVDPDTYNDPRAWEALATKFRTDVHQFDITGPKAAYVASGEVRGHPINQWAMSEVDGRLRVATTDGPTWGRPEGTDAPTSESFMTVLAPEGTQLTQLGQVGGIGRGEQIRSVRYDGDTAYVVTFLQTDPFYVLDLSVPTAPKVVGELKIAGYSGYLHPVGPGRVLGVGADATAQGRVTGAKVTLFDVSDRSRPKALSSWTLAGANTPVEFDAKAFLYWEATGLAVVPTQNWGPFSFTGAVGLRVTDRTVTSVGVITHDRPGSRGQTACRPLSRDEIDQGSDGKLLGFVVVDCAPGQDVVVSGFDCQPYTVAEINANYGAQFTAGPGHRLGICTLSYVQPVQRSIVVRDRLLTLTYRDLLSSDLRTLKPGALVAL